MGPRAKTSPPVQPVSSQAADFAQACDAHSAALAAFGFHPLAAVVQEAVALVSRGRLVWVNPAMLEIAGREHLDDFGDVRFQELFKDLGNGLPEVAGAARVECGLQRGNGGLRTVIAKLAAQVPEDGSEIWVLEDPTRLRMLEAEVLSLSRELHARNRELAALQEQLRGERSDREEMLNVVSHELRTPVTIVGGYNRLLLSEEVGPLTEEQRRFLVESDKGCRRLQEFIGRLLETTPACREAGEIIEVARGSLAEVISGVVDLLKPLLDEKRLAVEVAVAANADRTHFDRLRIEQVLTNLIGNAITHSPAGSVIEISTRRRTIVTHGPRCFFEVSVSDTGPGVPAEDRDRIFDAYVQAGGPRLPGSVGLGLALCKRLVQAHGGSIVIEGRAAGGSRFVFTLPGDAATGAG